MTNDKSLKPCPCCGGPGRIREGIGTNKTTFRFSVGCKDCLLEYHLCQSEQEAINGWNKRVPQTELLPLDEEEVRKLFEIFQLSTDYHDDKNFPCIPKWNYDDLIKYICQKFGTKPAEEKLDARE